MHRIIREDVEKICREDLPWRKLENNRILVTGATGFLGSYIVYSLLCCNEKYNLNITIYALCRNENKAFKLFNDYMNNSNLKFVFQDVSDEINDRYISDIIIHAASPANPYVVQQLPYKVIEANVIAYDKILKKAKKWGTKEILLFSSSAVYGYTSPENGADEYYRDNLDFVNYKDVYAMSKQMCEMMTSCFKRECNISVKTIRPFVVYGAGDSLKNHKCMIDFLKNCVSNQNILLKSHGEAVRSYIYVRDAIRAIFYILLIGDSDVYNIASEKNIYSIKKVAEVFCECNGNIKIEYQIDDADYLKTRTNRMTGKCTKLNELGFREEFNLKEGIQRTLVWAGDIMENYID